MFYYRIFWSISPLNGKGKLSATCTAMTHDSLKQSLCTEPDSFHDYMNPCLFHNKKPPSFIKRWKLIVNKNAKIVWSWRIWPVRMYGSMFLFNGYSIFVWKRTAMTYETVQQFLLMAQKGFSGHTTFSFSSQSLIFNFHKNEICIV